MIWTGHLACMREKRIFVHGVDKKILRKQNHFEDLSVDERLILKWFVKSYLYSTSKFLDLMP
jgi:hypothetical protein